ncbi:MAG: LysR family transcriptional regulator [Burkholderiales bacterium]
MAAIQPVHISRIDLNLFVVLETIHAEGGITRAAEKLHLSQPAISHALARLRELFDDPLFTRQGQVMVPTPLARSLIDPVRQALRSLEGTLTDTERFDPTTSRKRFTLGLRGAQEATLLPPLVASLAQAAPHVELAAVRVDRRRMESDLASGLLDLAVDVLVPVPDGIRHRRLASDRLVVMARQAHPRVRDPLGLATYLDLDHILVSSRRRGVGIEDVALQRLGHQRRVRLRCQQYFAACRVVAETDLVLTMPERQARVTNASFGHRVLPLPLEGPSLDSYLYWHAGTDTDAAGLWLRECIVAAVERTTRPSTGTE